MLPCEPGIEVEHAHMGVKQGGQVLGTEILSRNWDESVKAAPSVPSSVITDLSLVSEAPKMKRS